METTLNGMRAQGYLYSMPTWPAYENVLCETVVMHLDPSLIAPSVHALASLLRPGGTLYLSWRVTPGESIRDASGRLYAAFDKRVVIDALDSALGPAAITMVDRESTSASSGKRVHRLVAKRGVTSAGGDPVDGFA